MVILREGYVYFHFLANLSAHKLLLEARNERAGTNGQRIIRPLSALKRRSVHKALEINHSHIPILYRTILYCDRSGIVLALFINLCVYFLVCGCGIRLLYLDALVLSKSHFRLHCHLCCKNEGLALLDLLHADLRTGYQLQLALIHSLLIGAGDQLIYSVLIKELGTIHFLDHLARYLALTEARNGNLLSILQVSSLESALQFLGGHLNGKLCHVLL